MRVFIVEDSTVVRERLMALLTDVQGVEIIGHAEDAACASEFIRIFRPDTVILDLKIQGGSGIDVLREIRQLVPPPLIMVVTNNAIPQSRQRCFDAGADFFLDKTTEFEKLIEILQGLVQDAQQSYRGGVSL
ncbi:MAG TPA: response regulator transcription factor [Pyrinomonadaceae bacterium]